MSFHGLIFDWDGVIVDSSDLHRRSWEALSEELSLPLAPDHFKLGFGKRNETIIPEILQWTKDKSLIDQWGKRKECIYRDLGTKGGISLQPGALSFLTHAREEAWPCVVGTSTERSNVELACAQHRLADFFLGIISSEDVTSGKPNPEVFLKCAKLLNLNPCKCVVFEDSPHGIEAAKRAGMKTVALTTSHPKKIFDNLKPDFIDCSLENVNTRKIQVLFD